MPAAWSHTLLSMSASARAPWLVAASPVRGRTALGPAVSRAVADLPAAVVVALATTVVLGELCALAGRPLLHHPWGSRLLVLAVLVVTAAAMWTTRRLPEVTGDGIGRHTGAPSAAARAAGLPGWALVPATALAGYALVGRFVALPHRVEWFLGGDHVRHLLYVVDVWRQGWLGYDDQSYPRGWHTLLAALWSAGGARQDAAGLGSLVDLMASGSWLTYAVFVLASSGAAVALAARVGLPPVAATTAGFVAGALLLLEPFLASYLAMGFENSVIGALVLATTLREVLVGPPRWRALVVCLAGTVVVAHAWQLLLPAQALLTLWVVTSLARRGRRAAAVVVVAVVGAGVASLPALVAVVTEIGLGHATDAGVEAAVPWLVLLPTSVAVVALGVRWRAQRLELVTLGAVALPALTGLALAVAVGIPVTQYYPAKLLWHTAALGAVLLPVAVLMALVSLRQPWRTVTRPTAGVVAGALGIVGVLTPLGALVGSWSTVNGSTTMAAITSPGASSAQVAWLGSTGDDTIARILLDYYRVGTSSVRTPQPPLSVTQECELLRAAATPTVLSNRPATQVRARYDCVPDVRVVPVVPFRR